MAAAEKAHRHWKLLAARKETAVGGGDDHRTAVEGGPVKGDGLGTREEFLQ